MSMSKPVVSNRPNQPVAIDLLSKMQHLADGTQPITNQDFAKLLAPCKDDRKEIGALRAKYTTFTPEQIEQIKTQKLYLSLPEPARTNLYELVTPEREPLPASLVEVSDKMATALAYLALSKGDKEAIRIFPKMLTKCRKVFGHNIEALKGYINNFPQSEMVVLKAFAELTIRDDQPALSLTWQNLLAGDKERVVGRLLKNADGLDGVAPKSLDALLMANAQKLFPEVFTQIDALSSQAQTAEAAAAPAESSLAKGVTKLELQEFVAEYYKLSITSHGTDADKEIPLKIALQKSIEVITAPDAKTTQTDQMPDLSIPSYSALLEKEKAAMTAVTPSPVTQADEAKSSDDDTSPSAGAYSIRAAAKAKTPKKDYYMRKLGSGDLRGFYLGKLTSCCQSMDGNSREAVRHGMSQPDSGFYVIQEMKGDKPDMKKDRIVAQSWAWKSKDGKSIVFDSFERLGPEHEKLCRPFMKEAAAILKTSGYNYVGLGSGGNTPGFRCKPGLSSLTMREVPGFEFKKGLLYEDGRTQYDASNLPISLKELKELGLLDDARLNSELQKLDPIGKDMEAKTALYSGDGDLFKKIVQKGEVDISKYVIDLGVVLRLDKKSLDILLENGANLALKSTRGPSRDCNILEIAAYCGNAQLVEALIAQKVPVTSKAVEKAIKGSAIEVATILIETTPPQGEELEKLIRYVLLEQQPEILDKLVPGVASYENMLDAAIHYIRQPHNSYISAQKDDRCLKLMLEKGRDSINLRDQGIGEGHDNETLLEKMFDISQRGGSDFSVVDKILDAGADPRLENKYGRSLLDKARDPETPESKILERLEKAALKLSTIEEAIALQQKGRTRADIASLEAPTSPRSTQEAAATPAAQAQQPKDPHLNPLEAIAAQLDLTPLGGLVVASREESSPAAVAPSTPTVQSSVKESSSLG